MEEEINRTIHKWKITIWIIICICLLMASQEVTLKGKIVNFSFNIIWWIIVFTIIKHIEIWLIKRKAKKNNIKDDSLN